MPSKNTHVKTSRQHVEKKINFFFSTFALRSLVYLLIPGQILFQNVNRWLTTELMANALKWKCHITVNCTGINQQQRTFLSALCSPQPCIFCKFSMYRIMQFLNFSPFTETFLICSETNRDQLNSDCGNSSRVKQLHVGKTLAPL